MFRIVVVGDSVLRGDHKYGFDPHNMGFYLADKIQTEILPGQIEVLHYATGARSITGKLNFKEDPNY
jgi:hypothetical protein